MSIKKLPHKQETVFHIYEHWGRLVVNDLRLLSERTNMFLLASSILFTGFAFLFNKSLILGLALPVVGIFLCVIQYIIATGTVRAIMVSWDSLCRLEQDDPDLQSFIKCNLAPYSAFEKYWSDKQGDKGRPTGWLSDGPIRNSWFKKFGPATFSIRFIPIVFFILWVAGSVALGFWWYNLRGG